MTDNNSRHLKKEEAKPRRKGGARRVLRAAGTVILVLVLLVAGLLGYLSITEYRPADREAALVAGDGSAELREGDTFTIMTWNTGYGALGSNADFFMDGGSMVKTADEERVRQNMDSIITELKKESPEVIFLQETDRDSSRSEHIDELQMIQSSLPGYSSVFANNFKVAFLPYPVPPMGRVDSGIATFSAYPIEGATRIQLPVPFSWPVRMANLKRCVLVSRIPLEDADRQLVLVNLHLEAYDNGEGKAAQTAMLAEILNDEAAKGNYVIAGGDFNQIFSSADAAAYPAQEGKWQPGEIDVNAIDGGWQFIMDASVPSCRSLDQPYDGADRSTFQYYLIDGFIVSENVRVKSAETLDMGFNATDHNPVLMKIKLSNNK